MTLSDQHQARKRFGQNFLVDEGVIERIVRALAPKPADNLVEIGPGQGALTAELLEACPSLQVVELDRDLIPLLQARFAHYPEFRIHQGDALEFAFGALAQDARLRVVGNLPYNISTPLLFHLLQFKERIHDMHFMLQKEVVERLAAAPGDKTYGRLGIMCQYHCEVAYLFDVPPGAFRPVPKVDSAIVRLRPRTAPVVAATNEAVFANVVKTVFQMRRKTLRNGLKPLLSQAQLDALDAPLHLRAEALSITDFVKLANSISELLETHD